MLLFVVINSLADSSSKLLFISHSNLGVREMLLLRGILVLMMLAFLIGNNLKYILWQSVPSNMVAPLVIRCSTGLLAFYCMGTAIKHLPIVLVALF